MSGEDTSRPSLLDTVRGPRTETIIRRLAEMPCAVTGKPGKRCGFCLPCEASAMIAELRSPGAPPQAPICDKCIDQDQLDDAWKRGMKDAGSDR